MNPIQTVMKDLALILESVNLLHIVCAVFAVSLVDLIVIKISGKSIADYIFMVKELAEKTKCRFVGDKFDVKTDCSAFEAIGMLMAKGPNFDEMSEIVEKKIKELERESVE